MTNLEIINKMTDNLIDDIVNSFYASFDFI